MKVPRVRFTVWRMMVVVAISGLLTYVYRSLPSLQELLNDDPYHALRTNKKSWNAGPSPSISVDLFEGGITVLPSSDGTLWAELTLVAVTKNSQSAADGAIDAIELSENQSGDSLRITARGASEPGIKKDVGVTLYVPSGASLDLRVGRGAIIVGLQYVAGGPNIHRPVAARSIRARNDSDYTTGGHDGYMFIETIAPRPRPGEALMPTRLQLDSPGHIEIKANDAVVGARAWHGTPPKEWEADSYESLDEGSITFEGSLAEGDHSLHAAHRIEMKLQAASSLKIDAEASGGPLIGDMFPNPVERCGGGAKWVGSIGPERSGTLRLRTENGSINLSKFP